MRVLVCGGRDYADRAMVYAVLDEVAGVTDDEPLGRPDFLIIHGGATGADQLADDWAVMNWKLCLRRPVKKSEWDEHGKAAGPMRNQRMLDEGKPDLVIAFPGGKRSEERR